MTSFYAAGMKRRAALHARERVIKCTLDMSQWGHQEAAEASDSGENSAPVRDEFLLEQAGTIGPIPRG